MRIWCCAIIRQLKSKDDIKGAVLQLQYKIEKISCSAGSLLGMRLRWCTIIRQLESKDDIKGTVLQL
jgi:hypothetical protein